MANIVNQLGHVAFGSVAVSGSAVTVTTGFTPKVVMLRNKDNNCTLDWFEGMGNGAGQKIVDSGTGTTDISFITTGGITQAANGFTIGTDSNINPSGGATVFYLAIG